MVVLRGCAGVSVSLSLVYAVAGPAVSYCFLDSCSMFRVPSQLVFVICFDSPALSTHDQRCSLLFNVVFQTVLLYALPRGSSACPREIKVSKGHDKRRQGHDCDLGIRSGASLAFTPDSVSTHVL